MLNRGALSDGVVDSAPMLRRAPLRYAILAALALCAAHPPAAADDQTTLAQTWKSERPVPPELRKVLVVGIARDPTARRGFEDHFVTMLRAREVEAVTSYSIVPDLAGERDPALVLKALFVLQVEGVITVRLRPLDKTPEPERAKAWSALMAAPESPRDYVAAALRDFDSKSKELGPEVVFWSMSKDDERRVWAGRFPGAKIQTLRKYVSEMVETAINEMRFVGLY